VSRKTRPGAVTAAYVYGVPAANLLAKGYHSLVNAEQIAKLGVPGLDVIAVASNVIKSNPTLVQDYVCAELQGSRDMTGPQAAKYLAASSKVQGVPGNEIVAAAKAYPFIPPGQQLFWLGSALHDPNSPIVRAYLQTARFLVTQGRLTSVPSATRRPTTSWAPSGWTGSATPSPMSCLAACGTGQLSPGR
jgi:ABC-type taurine transport system substrate-binding protein